MLSPDKFDIHVAPGETVTQGLGNGLTCEVTNKGGKLHIHEVRDYIDETGAHALVIDANVPGVFQVENTGGDIFCFSPPPERAIIPG